jgi:hypothetical protein
MRSDGAKGKEKIYNKAMCEDWNTKIEMYLQVSNCDNGGI